MAFINGYVTDKDIEKYRIGEQWLKHHPAYKEIPSYVRLNWTFDDEKNNYLILMGIGKEEYSNRYNFIFNFNGYSFEVDVEKADTGILNLDENIYEVNWVLVNISPASEINKIEVFHEELKAALITYGYRGIERQVENSLVNFNF